MSVEIKNQAILTNKRVADPVADALTKDDWFKYIVDVQCSNCWLQTSMVFGYWTAVVCTGCRQPMQRTPYRAEVNCG